MVEFLRTHALEVMDRPKELRTRRREGDGPGSTDTLSRNPLYGTVLFTGSPALGLNDRAFSIDVCQPVARAHPDAKPSNHLVLNDKNDIAISGLSIREKVECFEKRVAKKDPSLIPIVPTSIRTIQNWEVIVDQIDGDEVITFGRNVRGGERLKITIPIAEIDESDRRHLCPGAVLHVIAGMQRRNGSYQRSSVVYVRRHPPRESIDGLVAASLLRKLTEGHV